MEKRATLGLRDCIIKTIQKSLQNKMIVVSPIYIACYVTKKVHTFNNPGHPAVSSDNKTFETISIYTAYVSLKPFIIYQRHQLTTFYSELSIYSRILN